MKNLLTSLIALLFVCTSAMAGSDLTITFGNKKFMKNLEGKAHLEFIWENATYANKQPLTEKYTNLDKLEIVAWNGFIEEFNDRSKKVKVVKKDEPAQYKFILQVKNMDQYFKVMGFIPSNATKLWGTLTVKDAQTNETIAVVEIEEIDGGANPSPDGCFSDCFEELGKQFSKVK